MRRYIICNKEKKLRFVMSIAHISNKARWPTSASMEAGIFDTNLVIVKSKYNNRNS